MVRLCAYQGDVPSCKVLCPAVVHDIVNPTHANKGGSGEASAFCLLSVVGRVITNCAFSR